MKIEEARKAFHSFRLEGDPNSIYKKVLIDGKEMKGVRSATICYETDAIPRVFLEMIATDISVDEPNAAVLFMTEEEKKNADDV